MTLFRLALEQQPHLDRVEASGCKALRNVISNSSVLSSCYLQACPRLAVSLYTLLNPFLMHSALAVAGCRCPSMVLTSFVALAEPEAAQRKPEAP